MGIRRRAKLPDGTLCEICGDEASGTHYTVASCDGCKTFFRRSIVQNFQYICQSNDNCLVDKSVRCGCRCCRLKKCFQVGMSRSAIQNDRDKVKNCKNRRIVNNQIRIRRKRRAYRTATVVVNAAKPEIESKNEKQTIISIDVKDCISIDNNSDNQTALTNQLIDDLVVLENRLNSVRLFDFQPYASLMSALNTNRRLFVDDDCIEWLNEHTMTLDLFSSSFDSNNSNTINSSWHYSGGRLDSVRQWIMQDLTLMIEWVKSLPIVIALIQSYAPLCSLMYLTTCYKNGSTTDESFLLFPNGTTLTRDTPFGPFDRSSPIGALLIDGVYDKIRQINIGISELVLYKLLVFCNPDAVGLSSKGKAIVADERASAFNRLYHRIVDVYGNDKALDIYSTLLMMTLTLNRVAILIKKTFEFEAIFNKSDPTQDLFKELILDEKFFY